MRGKYDIAIIGTGIGGSVLGSILARAGLQVVLIDPTPHPRFAIGESTVPETTSLTLILAAHYDVPELANLGGFYRVRRHVGGSSGIKRSFSFAYHREGQEHRGDETEQFPTWPPPLGPDLHYFRQDVDTYVYNLALKYGAVAVARAVEGQVEFDAEGVTIPLAGAEPVRARFVVDATGQGALLSRQLGLRPPESGLRTCSRALFTHMLGVRPYDDVGPAARTHGLPYSLHQGTLHHLFADGWMWVIPFDNHPGATNPLCSVGLCLDARKHPTRGPDPGEEFAAFVARHPSVARQFAGARPVRPWVSTGPMQYRSTALVGDRFALLTHAHAFVDPLFSSGLTLTMGLIDRLAWRIIAAARADDFTRERFAPVEAWFDRNLDYFDRLVSGSYVAFRDHGLWNAWHRFWVIGSFCGLSGQQSIWARYQQSGDPAAFDLFEHKPYRDFQGHDLDEFAAVFARACALIEAVERGELEPAAASAAMFQIIAECGLWPPEWRLDDPTRRYPSAFTLGPMLRMVTWGRNHAPAAIRDNYFKYGRLRDFVANLWRGVIASGAGELRDGLARAVGLVRDSVAVENSRTEE